MHKDVVQVERYVFVEQESRLYHAHINERNTAKIGMEEIDYFKSVMDEIESPALMDRSFLLERLSSNRFCLNDTMSSMDGLSGSNASDDLVDLVKFAGSIMKSVGNIIGNVDVFKDRRVNRL